MPNKLTPESANEGPDPLHNIAALNQCLIDGFKRRLDLENHIDELIASHVAESKAELKEMKQKMKADTGIDSTDLNNEFRIYKRQENAKKLDDDDAKRIADNQRTLFGAMAKGKMLDFIDVLDNVNKKKTS